MTLPEATIKRGPGRPKGSKNRVRKDIAERLDALGCDPIRGLAKIAVNRKAPWDTRARCYSDLLSYCFPKLKSVEVRQEVAIDIADRLARAIEASRVAKAEVIDGQFEKV